MLQKCAGIVLQTLKYGDSSLILKVYTLEFGLISIMAKGVRSKRSKGKAASLQLLNQLEFVIYRRPGRDLHLMRDCRLACVYHHLPYDVRRSSVGMFICELLNKTLHGEEPDPELYRFILGYLEYLDKAEPIASLHHHFCLHYSNYLGFFPQPQQNTKAQWFDLRDGTFKELELPASQCIPPPLSSYVDKLMRMNFDQLEDLHLEKEQRRKLLSALLDFYRWQVDGFGDLRSVAVLEQLSNP